MHALKFVLSPQAVVHFHDAILCLARFSETVSLEATSDALTLSTLNSSKTADALFSFGKDTFFEEYEFNAASITSIVSANANEEAKFACQLYNKALLSIFKGRLGDARDKDTAIERCECFVQDRKDETECRLIVKMLCRHGVIKTYKLSYELAEVMHALFNRNAAKNTWTITSTALRSFVEYFGAKTEELDISNENGRTTFTSYTERLMNGKDVLKQPLQTSITVDNLEFEDFQVEEGMHICIMVKDFKSIVSHAETVKTSVTAAYTFPTRPMQLTYEEEGMYCCFTIMTTGEYRGTSATPTPAPAARRQNQAEATRSATPRQGLDSGAQSFVAKNRMPPPSQPASRSFTRELPSQRVQRPSPPPPRPSLNPESLFLPADEDEDRQWGERNYDEEEDTLGWNASAVRTSDARDKQENRAVSPRLEPYPPWPDDAKTQLPPTQRLSEVENLFGD